MKAHPDASGEEVELVFFRGTRAHYHLVGSPRTTGERNGRFRIGARLDQMTKRKPKPHVERDADNKPVSLRRHTHFTRLSVARWSPGYVNVERPKIEVQLLASILEHTWLSRV